MKKTSFPRNTQDAENPNRKKKGKVSMGLGRKRDESEWGKGGGWGSVTVIAGESGKEVKRPLTKSS